MKINYKIKNPGSYYIKYESEDTRLYIRIIKNIEDKDTKRIINLIDYFEWVDNIEDATIESYAFLSSFRDKVAKVNDNSNLNSIWIIDSRRI